MRFVLIWGAVLMALIGPLAIAATSPYLAWRDPIYIVAGFAGIVAMALLLLQPLLVAGGLPGVPRMRGRRVHLWSGVALVVAVLVHVGGLWITSPPDVVDALLFVSATPFSAWGVIAMWALFGAALLGAFRRRLGLTPRLWRLLHSALVATVALGSVVHALLIEGTMGFWSKLALCLLVLAALIWAFGALNTKVLLKRKRVS